MLKLRHLPVVAVFVGIDRSAGFYAAPDDRLHAGFSAVGDYTGADLAAAFQHSHHDALAATALPHIRALFALLVHIPSLAADEGFVHFNLAAQVAAGQIVLHCKANTVK